MKKTKSKLDLKKLQEEFDELLANFTPDRIVEWKHHDLKLQGEKLFSGKVIEVNSNPVFYSINSCDINDEFYSKLIISTDYANAA